LERGRSLALAATANLILTVALNAIFMSLWGVVGIALATAPAFLVTAILLYLPIDQALARSATARASS